MDTLFKKKTRLLGLQAKETSINVDSSAYVEFESCFCNNFSHIFLTYQMAAQLLYFAL